MDLVARLPEDEALHRPNEEWSAGDSLLHLASWKEKALRVARQRAEPGARDPGSTKGPAGALHINVDRFNNETLAARRNWSPPGRSAGPTRCIGTSWPL